MPPLLELLLPCYFPYKVLTAVVLLLLLLLVMKPLKQRRQQFVRLVAKVLLDAQLNRPARRASSPHVIHPGGPLAAFRHAELLLKGSPKMFHELFRVT